MSDIEQSDKHVELITKLNKVNKQTKAIYDTLQKIVEKTGWQGRTDTRRSERGSE